MENNVYHLDQFTNSMLQHFNEVLVRKNYDSDNFRKYHLKDGEDPEFSFRLKVPTAATFCDEKLCNAPDPEYFTREDCEKLISCSKQWSLQLSEVSVKENRILFKLNKSETFSTILKLILNEQTKYGLNFTLQQDIKITILKNSDEDITNFRLELLKRTAENLLSGFRTSRNNAPEKILEVYLTTKITDNSKINVLCGIVSNAMTRKKEVAVTRADFYNTHYKDMLLMSEHKMDFPVNDQLPRDLAHANVTMALLEVNPKRVLSLKADSRLGNTGGTMSKGASFVLYNFARLVSLIKKFNTMCDSGIYPKPPNFEDMDFGLLSKEEEWLLVFNYLLEYPTMLRKIAEGLYKGEFHVHLICRFLYNMSSLFSVYYRKTRILLEPRDHLLPVIYARILLLQGIVQVMENALSLLNITPIHEM